MKKESFYFPHDYNSRNDIKCLFLRQQLGMEGFGIFWFLIECLAEAGGELPLKIVPVLAMQMQVPDVKVLAVIKNFELFEIREDTYFFSNRLNQHLQLRKTLSDQGKKGASLRWGNSPPNSPPNNDPNAKERKGKEIKERKERVPHGNFQSELTKDRHFIETTCIAWYLNETEIQKMIKDFTLEQTAKSKTWADYPDFKGHFFSWGKYNSKFMEYKKKEKKMVD